MWRNQHTNRTCHQESLAALGATPEEIEQFTELLLKRRELQEELGNALVQVENMRVEIGNVHSLWMSFFGEVYLRCETEYERMLLMQTMLEHLEKNPSLTRPELEELGFASRTGSEQRLQKLRRDVLLSSHSKLPPYREPIFADEELIAARHEEAARVARQIWRLIHSDALRHYPALEKLSKNEREYFEELQRRLMRPRAAELGFDPCQHGFEHRSPAELHRILGEVKTILASPGEDVDLDELIVGDTSAEQLAWLQADIVLLEQGVNDAQADLCRLIDDSQYAERRFALAVPEQHNAIRERLLEQAEAYAKEADKLAKELGHMLGEGKISAVCNDCRR